MKGVLMMFGIQDASIWLAYVLSIGSALLCIIYGIANWNKGDNNSKGGGNK